MKVNVGKVDNYDGLSGDVITSEKTYIFSYTGLEENVENGDIVTFAVRDEENGIIGDIKKYRNKSLDELIDDINKKYENNLIQHSEHTMKMNYNQNSRFGK
ncbi:MAG: hypothetical protein IKR57_04085 [Bacilli bacterium]|nr:hypothetical protein [Bacilli bacterium]